ncbi:hypothetical protein [Rhodoferax sp.]|uniref:hypothetical protein n=1 Tax=Rhodoferax sp. TaxID=50421 RepID=UPI00284EFAB7|nr:hypothetical protein [Rhodoferax sp.]MDR3368998.1 hypothetical protein [Rhodoferax sp.]
MTDVDYKLSAIGHLYRDCCDCVDLGLCQNGFALLAPMHAEADLIEIKTMITNVQQAIAYVKRSAEQLPKVDRWRVLVGYICERITRQTVLHSPPSVLSAAG